MKIILFHTVETTYFTHLQRDLPAIIYKPFIY
jgi:hypothetical protein